MAELQIRTLSILMSVRLVQPGRLSDILEGLRLLIPSDNSTNFSKEKLSEMLGKLREKNLVCLYAGQRYELTARGNEALENAQIKEDIDVRRMFLLKASRRDSPSLRSDTRDGLLKQ